MLECVLFGMHKAHLEWIKYLLPESSQKVVAKEETSVMQRVFERLVLALILFDISINCLDDARSLLVKSVA